MLVIPKGSVVVCSRCGEDTFRALVDIDFDNPGIPVSGQWEGVPPHPDPNPQTPIECEYCGKPLIDLMKLLFQVED